MPPSPTTLTAPPAFNPAEALDRALPATPVATDAASVAGSVSPSSSLSTSSQHIVPDGMRRSPSPTGNSRAGSPPRRSSPPRVGSNDPNQPRGSDLHLALEMTSLSRPASASPSSPSTGFQSMAATPTSAAAQDGFQFTGPLPADMAQAVMPVMVRAPLERVPGGLAPLRAATVPSHRDVNPRMNLTALAQALPDDVTGCVAFLLSAMRRSPADIPALEQLATQQAQVLSDRGIRTKDDFVALLKQVQWRELGTGMLHGMAAANGFNVGSAIVNFKVADMTLNGLFKAMPHASAMLPGLAAGAALGFALSIMDVAASASAGKTFADAYFTRPPEDKLPPLLRDANPHTPGSMAKDISMAAGLSYGVARNLGLRIPMMLGYEFQGQPEQRAKADNLADPLGGSVIGGGGMRVIRNDRDAGAGRAGFQHFLARSDLGECVDHLQKPALEQMESGLRRGVDYAKNVGLTLPTAVGDAFASKLGWTSHAILAPGFGLLFSMLTTMPNELQNKGWRERDANIATQLCKFAVLQVLYHLWGAALGAVGAPRTPAPHLSQADAAV